MAAKEFSYRGKKIEELKQMDAREFSKLAKSRERRTILRQFNEIEAFVNKCRDKTQKGKKIKTHDRDIIIVPKMIDYNIMIYNGKQFIPVTITQEMIGHRLGEFAATRGRINHGSAGVGATKSSMIKKK